MGGSRNISELAADAAKEAPALGRDVVEALAGDYWTELQKAVEKNAEVLNEFYILVTRRAMAVVPNNVYRQIFIGCSVKPRAAPHTDCWHVDVQKEEITLLWTLPSSRAIKEIAASSATEIDPFLKDSCREYDRGELNREQTAAARRELVELVRELPGVQLAPNARGTAKAF